MQLTRKKSIQAVRVGFYDTFQARNNTAPGIKSNNTFIPKSNVCLVYFCVGFNNKNFQALFKHHKIQHWKTQ
jgi:hypothetical protein